MKGRMTKKHPSIKSSSAAAPNMGSAFHILRLSTSADISST
jgi:hypothetical protein